MLCSPSPLSSSGSQGPDCPLADVFPFRVLLETLLNPLVRKSGVPCIENKKPLVLNHHYSLLVLCLKLGWCCSISSCFAFACLFYSLLKAQRAVGGYHAHAELCCTCCGSCINRTRLQGRNLDWTIVGDFIFILHCWHFCLPACNN